MTEAHAGLSGQDQRRRGQQARDGGGDLGQRGNKWWTLAGVCLGTFMLLLDITIVNVALPDIQKALHSSFSDLQWIVDAYALTLAAFLLTAGSLADMYGRRLLWLIGLVVFTGASVLCGFAVSTLMLQLSRALQGVGGAIMFAVSLALLADAFRGKDRGTAFGAWGAVTGLAVAIGPLLGGVLTSGLSWRWIFFVNVPIGIAAAVISVMKVTESRAPQASGPDWPGFVLFTVALASLVYGLIESNQRSFTDGLVLGCFAAAAVLLAAFVLVERRRGAPDVRPDAVQAADLQRRLGRGVRAQRLHLLDAALPRAVPAGHSGLLAAGYRRAGDVPVGSHPGDRHGGRQAFLAGAGPAADRARPAHGRRGPAADARAQRGLGLDPSHPRNDRGRRSGSAW